jgi:hypothetical protein
MPGNQQTMRLAALSAKVPKQSAGWLPDTGFATSVMRVAANRSVGGQSAAAWCTLHPGCI